MSDDLDPVAAQEYEERVREDGPLVTPEPVEALVERVRAGLRVRTTIDGLPTGPQAALTELAERVKAAERERDALLAAIVAEPPDAEAVRYFQRLHGLPEVGLIGEAEPPGWGADRRCPETCG